MFSSSNLRMVNFNWLARARLKPSVSSSLRSHAATKACLLAWVSDGTSRLRQSHAARRVVALDDQVATVGISARMREHRLQQAVGNVLVMADYCVLADPVERRHLAPPHACATAFRSV